MTEKYLQIQNSVNEQFKDRVNLNLLSTKDDFLSLEINDKVFDLIKFLKENHNFHFLTDLCGMHYPDQPKYKFAVVYHLHNWIENKRVRIKCLLSSEPQIESVVSLYESANWQERETYDFYGINFLNHPDLRRILNMDEMESFPLRKEYPLEDAGRTDKDDRYFGRNPQNK